MNINPIALDNLTSALESGETIDTDDHRDTVVALVRDFCQRPAQVDADEPEGSRQTFKSYPNLPRA